jgi:exodeoxyribonuclease III
MRLCSWNVNGIRAVEKRGDLAWLFQEENDVICLQETKIHADQVTDSLRSPPGYRSFWSFADKKGHSGTVIYVREQLAAKPAPLLVGGSADPDFDREGRVVGVDLGALVLFNVYFPNGGRGGDRLSFKHRWHDAFLAHMVRLAKDKPVVVCGDFNVAHRPLDVARPEQWASVSGFLPAERAWFDRMLQAGFLDSFRAEKGDLTRQFTWWDQRVEARKDNVGWRIDYFILSASLEEKLLDAWISPQIMGSDHCPIGVELDVPLQLQNNGDGAKATNEPAVAEVVYDDGDEDDDDNDDDPGGRRWRR